MTALELYNTYPYPKERSRGNYYQNTPTLKTLRAFAVGVIEDHTTETISKKQCQIQRCILQNLARTIGYIRKSNLLVSLIVDIPQPTFSLQTHGA